jgi:hypothetical protein
LNNMRLYGAEYNNTLPHIDLVQVQ